MSDIDEKILVVDDEEAIRRLLTQKLTSIGYGCVTAENAADAMEVLRVNRVSLVILDVRMPGKSGLEVLPDIKSCYPDTSVIMATAVGEIETVVSSMKLGAYDYLSKPFNLTQMVLSVRRALATRSLELELRDYHENLARKVEEQSKQIRAAFLSSVTSLAFALEAKDGYTSGHSQRASKLAVAIAGELDLYDGLIEKIRIAGLLHDIGKIGIPETILNKPSRLTPEEYGRVRMHCEVGERILRPIVEDEETLSIVRHHHERFDGKGYPDGLARDSIPIGARILAVADTYDAITSERPYRRAMSPDVAVLEIGRNCLTQFDPSTAGALLRVFQKVEAP